MINILHGIYGKKRGGVITNNLLFYVDASNTLSYSGSGSTWSDISGNGNNFTLVNSPTFDASNGGNFIFDGTNQYAKSSFLPSELLGNVDFTISGWFKNDLNDISSEAVWGFGNKASENNINAYSTNANQISLSLAGVEVIFSTQNYIDTQYKHIAWVKRAGLFSRSNIDIYVNGVKYSGGTLVSQFGNETVNPNVLAGSVVTIAQPYDIDDGVQNANVSVASFYGYDKALIESEVLENFNADKAKFGY